MKAGYMALNSLTAFLKQVADILCPSMGSLHDKADNRENYVIEVVGLTKTFRYLRLWTISPSKVRQGEYSAFWEPQWSR